LGGGRFQGFSREHSSVSVRIALLAMLLLVLRSSPAGTALTLYSSLHASHNLTALSSI